MKSFVPLFYSRLNAPPLLAFTTKEPDGWPTNSINSKWILKNITIICSILDWPWIKEAYNERKPYDQKIIPLDNPKIYAVEKETLFLRLRSFLILLT